MFGIDIKYFSKSISYSMLREIGVFISSFLLTIILTRYISKELYGQYQLVLSIVGIISITSIPGLTTALIRAVAKGKEGTYYQVLAARIKYGIIGVLALVSIGAYYSLKKSTVGYSLLALSLFFIAIYSLNNWSPYLRGKKLFGKDALLATIQSIMLLICVGLAAAYTKSLIAIIIGYAIAYSTTNIIYHKIIRPKKRKKDNEVIKYGFFLTKLSAAGMMLQHLDKIIVSFLGIKILAVYGLALNLLNLTKNIIKSLFSVTLPKFSEAKHPITAKRSLFVLLVGSAVAIMLFIISRPLIELVYTSNYSESARLFKYSVFLIPILFFNSLWGYKLLGERKEKEIITLNLINPLLSLIAIVFAYTLTKNFVIIFLTKVYFNHLLNFLFILRKSS